jgi:hypothetical protein
MNDIVEYKPLTPQTAEQVKAQVATIQEIMKSVMIKDVHYGIIPGTKKPTLYKAGSDMLLSAFNIAVEPVIEDLSTYQEIRYRIQVRGIHMASNGLVGIGIGEASSNEERYKWKKTSDREYAATPEDRRRIKFARVWNDHQRCMVEGEIKQVRTEPVDQANTILKMAKKRAQVDMTLTCLAASDVFDQPSTPASSSNMSRAPQNNYPAESDYAPGGGDQPVNVDAESGEINLGHVRTAIDKSGLREIDLWAHLEVVTWNEVSGDKLVLAMKWIEENSP